MSKVIRMKETKENKIKTKGKNSKEKERKLNLK